MSYLTDIRTLIYKEKIVMSRYPVRILANTFFPIFFVLIFTFTSLLFVDPSNSQEISQLSGRMFAGVVIYVFLNSGSDLSQSIIDEQQQGTIESLYLAPVSKYLNVVAIILIRFAFVLLTLVPYYYFMVNILGKFELHNLGLATLFLICAIFQIAAFGIFFAGFTLRAKELAPRLAFFITFLIMIFAGIFVPFEALGNRMIIISYLLPFSYSMDGFSAALLDTKPFFMRLQLELGINIILSILTMILSTKFFLKVEKSLRIDGKLMDY